VTRVALVEQCVVVGLVARGERVADLDQALLRKEDHVRSETRVPDALFLQVAQAQNAAGKNGPELGFGESVFSKIALVDLIIKRALWVLIQDVQFIKGGAVLILFLFKVFSEGNEMI
jgi:hypothetical protein